MIEKISEMGLHTEMGIDTKESTMNLAMAMSNLGIKYRYRDRRSPPRYYPDERMIADRMIAYSPNRVAPGVIIGDPRFIQRSPAYSPGRIMADPRTSGIPVAYSPMRSIAPVQVQTQTINPSYSPVRVVSGERSSQIIASPLRTTQLIEQPVQPIHYVKSPVSNVQYIQQPALNYTQPLYGAGAREVYYGPPVSIGVGLDSPQTPISDPYIKFSRSPQSGPGSLFGNSTGRKRGDVIAVHDHPQVKKEGRVTTIEYSFLP